MSVERREVSEYQVCGEVGECKGISKLSNLGSRGFGFGSTIRPAVDDRSFYPGGIDGI